MTEKNEGNTPKEITDYLYNTATAHCIPEGIIEFLKMLDSNDEVIRQLREFFKDKVFLGKEEVTMEEMSSEKTQVNIRVGANVICLYSSGQIYVNGNKVRDSEGRDIELVFKKKCIHCGQEIKEEKNETID